MQSHGEESVLHSCFDLAKSCVMGCCYSICHKETDPQENVISEQSPLLASQHVQQTPVSAASPTTPPRVKDEQSALNKILHETAINVIDVGALGPYDLEPGVYSERVRAYTARLASTPSAPPPPPPPALRLLVDVSQSERNALLAKPQPNADDREFITNAVKRAAAAISELRVEHLEELVVPFRVP